MNRVFRRCVALIALQLLAFAAVAAEPMERSSPYSEADMLPVRSVALTPGMVRSRPHSTPRLPALFLIGDDPRSRTWLQQRLPILQRLKAVGLVVQVESVAGLEQLRSLAPRLTLSPVAADDLATRLNLQHYPVLITATAIEQ